MKSDQAAGLRASIGDYVSRLEGVQSDLLALYRRKRVALAAADVTELQSLTAFESDGVERLKTLGSERQRLLVQAAQLGAANSSLSDVATAIGSDGSLHDRIAKCRRRAAELRREGWVHWVVAQRSITQTTALLELIAHRGDRPPTYDGGSSSAGGTLLDTSA